jgi:hypothetical protein
MWSARRVLTAVNLGFLDRRRYYSFKQLLSYPHEAKWTPFQSHFSENLLVTRIVLGTSGPVCRNSDHYTTENGHYRYQQNIINFVIIIRRKGTKVTGRSEFLFVIGWGETVHSVSRPLFVLF